MANAVLCKPNMSKNVYFEVLFFVKNYILNIFYMKFGYFEIEISVSKTKMNLENTWAFGRLTA